MKLSSDGSKVAMMVRTTNWRKNHYEYCCHVHDLALGMTRQINRDDDVDQMEWFDNETLVLLKKDDGKAQIFLYEGLTGEGWQATDHKTGVEWFKPFAGACFT